MVTHLLRFSPLSRCNDTAGENSCSTQMFINLKDNKHFNPLGMTPFAKVSRGWPAVEQLYKE